MIGIRDRNEPNGYKTNSTTQKVDATLSSTSNNPPSNKAVRNAMPFNFGIDEDGNYGYIPIGADSVVPFKLKFHQENVSVPINQKLKVTMGFKPKHVTFKGTYSGYVIWGMYDENVGNTFYVREYNGAVAKLNIPRTDNYIGIASVDEDGVTFQSSAAIMTITVDAIG